MSIISNRLEFESCLNKFYNEINSCSNDSAKWEMETTQTILKQSFLKRKMHIAIAKRPNNVDVDSITLDDEEEEESCAVQDSTEIIQLEHHIVYSTSFQVPVLYFRVSFSDGTPLSHQEIFQFVIPNDYHDANITQNEHPILGKPCWYIHPCNTRGLMETMAFDQLDYIKAWLSVYGPIAKYNIPSSMFQ